MVGRDDQRLLDAAGRVREQTSIEPVTIAADLSRSEERVRLFATYPDVEILLNNAGAIPGGALESLSIDRWREAWELKVFGYIHLTQLYFAAMSKRGKGTILNVIGMAGSAPRWDYICGSSGNAALIAFTQAVGARAPDFGLRVFGINPPLTRTGRMETVLRAQAHDKLGSADRWRELAHALPFGRPAEPEEVATLCVVLASPRAAYLSGTVIDLDGGNRHRSA